MGKKGTKEKKGKKAAENDAMDKELGDSRGAVSGRGMQENFQITPR